MQTDADPRKHNKEDCPSKTSRKSFTCDGCERTFQRPIFATVSTSGQIQKYYACPRCMTKVNNIKAPESDREEITSTSMMEPKKLDAEFENMAKCKHFFGYLKKRQKETPIPEECLTCVKMFECLFYDAKL